MLRSFEGTTPSVSDSAYVDPAAVVIGSVVTGGTEIPPATLAVGSPASVETELDEPDTAAAEHYRELATRYEESSERVE